MSALSPPREAHMDKRARYRAVIGRRLATARERRGLSVDDVVDAGVGVGRSALYDYERGDTMPPADVLGGMAELYGVSVDFLVPRPSNPSAPVYLLDEDVERSILEATSVTDHVRAWMVRVAIAAGEGVIATTNPTDVAQRLLRLQHHVESMGR